MFGTKGMLRKNNMQSYQSAFSDLYHVELEIKETTDDQYHSSFLDLLLEIDNDSRPRLKIYDIINAWTRILCILVPDSFNAIY